MTYDLTLSDDEVELILGFARGNGVVFGKVDGPVVPFVFGVTATGPAANQVVDLNVVGQMLVKQRHQVELSRVDKIVVKVCSQLLVLLVVLICTNYSRSPTCPCPLSVLVLVLVWVLPLTSVQEDKSSTMSTHLSVSVSSWSQMTSVTATFLTLWPV